VVLYNPSDDLAAMFADPVAVIKDGLMVTRDGEIVAQPPGRTLHARVPPIADGGAREAFDTMLRDRFETTTTVPFEDFAVP